jgi:hypothetical protein
MLKTVLTEYGKVNMIGFKMFVNTLQYADAFAHASLISFVAGCQSGGPIFDSNPIMLTIMIICLWRLSI